ncbi:acyltransferase [Marinilactibacillus psychrotolerans]|uniref:Acyltransferase n=1 Tax=Marinilactibacillus psychrotolerans TaxID=191770 RepID=A0AAV3WSB9_9LACT|nr:acyltransferase [Marinilactibacillus psychrotolerans]GEL67591.1 hypothetical protein MPS01_17460 [Marinilactibacillus psychrotolerans]GEQ35523.1 hypothetical protein M132T_10310 [Marinilactibacillus psychrotolerans]SDD08271.1 transferase hexapeptide (six repeat-containing protein) [Marinilactibacillus psychrotolerans]
MKRFCKNAFILISKIIMPLFYEKEYLRGKWFDNNVSGWKWCWKGLLWQKILGINRKVPWPVSFKVTMGSGWKNIKFNLDDMNNFQGFGVYFQSFYADIFIGKGTYIGPNVGLITANHDPENLENHLEGESIILGEKCWIGMNSVILPGVNLGNHTIVAAGSVVTKSFSRGNYMIGGVPAKIIKDLDTMAVKNDEY